ncbi:MAG: bis(5'-nucleosyl)-tetraphosphatase (symmetrical) YqeK [Clostridia bacterium]|nr:bis(5'-nucleosyl)-tetraphosphatase (symmetrical) YqeK [Clostridia bacterium]
MMYMNMSYQEAKVRLSETLPPKRFTHSLNVMELCGQLAPRYGIDRDKALTAGLLHDCAKYIDGEQMVAICIDRGYQPDAIQMQATHLLHPIVGSFIAREEFGVEDEDILNAIANHTCGRPGMSDLELLVFSADYCEVGRTHGDAVVAREVLGRNLQRAALHILDNVIRYNQAKGVTVHPASIKTKKYYSELVNSNVKGNEVK